MKEKTKGYLCVASCDSFFYKSAINLFEAIKDFDPDAKTCLFTEKQFLDGREVGVVDDLFFLPDVDENKKWAVKNNHRAKMWGMKNTPYDVTFYMDADMECVHEDILTVFDELKDDDIKWTVLDKPRRYCFVEVLFPAGELWLCGGVTLYDITNPLVREFMEDWWNLYNAQREDEWWPEDENGNPDLVNYPESLKRWDQFTLWWLTSKEEKFNSLKSGVFDNDARWNYYSKYKDQYDHTNGTEIVLIHYSDGNVKKAV